ncbi:hypothetical protein [Nocardia phage KYD2]|nr:hypothetical protein [Nocardia phage KYD2]
MSTSTHTTFVTNTTDGATHTRSSKSRDYVAALQVTNSRDVMFPYSWHMTREAALKAITGESARYGFRNPRVLEVTAYPYSSPEAKAARATEKAELAARTGK